MILRPGVPERCYSESRGRLILAEKGRPVHQIIEDLPRPPVHELERRTRNPGGADDQFLESNSTLADATLAENVDQFWQTLEADGLYPATKGFLQYNPLSQQISRRYEQAMIIAKNLVPERIHSYLTGIFHSEIEHHEVPGLIRCIDWHPRFSKVAIGLKDDSVKIWYEGNTHVIPHLKHKRQLRIHTLAWKPVVEEVLVVGCHDCAIIWTIEPSSISNRPGSGCAQVINSPGDQPVHSLSWDPFSSLLALSSKNATFVEIWDTDREELVQRQVGCSCVAHVGFSNSGEKVVVSGIDTIAIFSCVTWSNEGTWRNLGGPAMNVCWSHDDQKIIFGIKNKIFIASFEGIMGPDEVAREIEFFDGEIIQMAWHNQRLAVSVQGHDNCFLYSTQVNQAGLMDIELVGELPGPSPATFIHMKPSPPKDVGPGTLLSLVHEDGEIQNIPLFYKTSNAAIHAGSSMMNETNIGYMTALDSNFEMSKNTRR